MIQVARKYQHAQDGVGIVSETKTYSLAIPTSVWIALAFLAGIAVSVVAQSARFFGG